MKFDMHWHEAFGLIFEKALRMIGLCGIFNAREEH
jgi:hypothetical protein